MPSIAQNSTVNISLAAGDYINLTGSGSWSYIATVSGREIASGSYVGPDVVGPFTKACSVGITCGPVALSYTTSDFDEGNAAAQAFTTEDVTSLKAVVSGDWIVKSASSLPPRIALESGDFALSRVMIQGAVPIGIPSSGSVAANGALTLTTALASTYNNGIFLYFPAGAVYSASVAGYYWCVMSSTTAGVVFDNRYSSGTPTPPASATAIAAAGPGAYTQTTNADLTCLSETVAAGEMGAFGRLEYHLLTQHTNNANAKYCGVWLGGQQTAGTNLASKAQNGWLTNIWALGSQAKQKSMWAAGGDVNSAGTYYGFSVDMTAAQVATVTLKITTATDYVIVEAGHITVHPKS